jgi:hypothetical protein
MHVQCNEQVIKLLHHWVDPVSMAKRQKEPQVHQKVTSEGNEREAHPRRSVSSKLNNNTHGEGRLRKVSKVIVTATIAKPPTGAPPQKRAPKRKNSQVGDIVNKVLSILIPMT